MALPNPFDFTGKTVVLTGAPGGPGRPITLAFARSGARLALCARREGPLKVLADEARAAGVDVEATVVNLTQPQETEAWVEATRARFGAIDVLVNLVGGIIHKSSLEYSLEDWQHVMDIDLKACWIVCQTVGRVNGRAEARPHRELLLQRRHARGAGLSRLQPRQGRGDRFHEGPGRRVGPHGICTKAVSPGTADTPINADVLSDPRRVDAILRRMPLGQVLPADALVGPTLFLASDAARWINGHTINVDTGFNAT